MKIIDDFLNDKMILTESKCGSFSGYYIYINTKDSGNIPHFHMKDIETRGKRFHTCIQLCKNNYFLHEGKMDIITSIDVRKSLMVFLMAKPTKIPKEIRTINSFPVNNWQMMCYMWNYGPRNIYVNIAKTRMPNYITINTDR